MYSGFFLILIPLSVGYILPSLPISLQKIVNYLLSSMVYIILFFMGINLAFLPDLTNNLCLIFLYSCVSALCILLMNTLALSILDKKLPWYGIKRIHSSLLSPWRIFCESFQLCGVIATGFLFGLTKWSLLNQVTWMNEILLIILLWLVGIQLRNNGMTIRQIFLNRRGVLIAIVVATSALFGGVIAALLLGLPLHIGLALSSAYGWYSLSYILMTDAFGTVIGSTAFFNDLLRELIAIILIPILIPHRTNTALGLCGASSMDFTLPILKKIGGIEVVPAAIVHGFILSILAPILLALFSVNVCN